MQEYWIDDSIKDKPFGDFYELGSELGKYVCKSVYDDKRCNFAVYDRMINCSG